MIEEIFDPGALLCPNVTSFKVKGGQLAYESLWLEVKATEKAWNSKALDLAAAYTADISHYFNADEY